MRSRRPGAALRRKALAVDWALLAFYGPPRRQRRLDPVGTLIAAILSQHTTDANSDRAYTNLRARFPTWEAVRDAPLEVVAEAIRPAGLAAQRAPRIRAVLRAIPEEGGRPSLEFLRRWPVERAKAWLRALPGIGPKTAAIVLLFGLGRPAFPVDTHVYRVARRIGLLPPGVSQEAAHDWMERLVPPERYAAFHLLLVRHGRRICRAQGPRCGVCPVRGLCTAYRSGAV
jgi:endonuclease-3